MEAGHNYLLAGTQMPDGSLNIQVQDMTYMPGEIYGDEVADAPKASITPTEFEGTWNDGNGSIFIFAGNSWEWTIQPGTSVNTGTEEVKMKGTFATADGIVTMYVTDVYANKRWVSVTAIKSAYIFKYSFEGGELAMDGALPQATFTKQ
jgi:hypothetical protein